MYAVDSQLKVVAKDHHSVMRSLRLFQPGCVSTPPKRYVLVGYDTGLSIRVTGVQILLPLLKLRASYLKAIMVLLPVTLVLMPSSWESIEFTQ